MTEVWFLFLMVGLKVPVVLLIWFLYRTMRRYDQRWESGLGWDGNDGGGGGGPQKPTPPRRPGGPHRRVRVPVGPERSPVLGSPLGRAPRRPAPATTRVTTRTRP